MKKLIVLLLVSCVFLFSACVESPLSSVAMSDTSVKVSDKAGILKNDILYVYYKDNPYWFNTSKAADDSYKRGKKIADFDGNRIYLVKDCSDMSAVLLMDENDNLLVYSHSSDPRHFTEDEREIRAIADKALKEKFSFVDLDWYEVKVDINENNGNISVGYGLVIYGYGAREWYYVKLSPDRTVTDIIGQDSEYAGYINNIRPENIRKAELLLDERVKKYEDDKSSYYLSKDSDGNLCISTELIIDDPTHTAPCGDHDHVFLYEIISEAK